MVVVGPLLDFWLSVDFAVIEVIFFFVCCFVAVLFCSRVY